MARYKVLRALEHGAGAPADTLHIPEGVAPPGGATPLIDQAGKQIGWQVKSAGHGGLIAVDASGEIELSDREAALLPGGTVAAVQAKKQRPAGKEETKEAKLETRN